ncbi:MAG: asparagine N-glycosylation enzyme membrane subunit Stt3 [Gammaproteobacteria bacterium]|jgi:asparagine N-glycosylation enzyme membrane subunit Stt3
MNLAEFVTRKIGRSVDHFDALLQSAVSFLCIDQLIARSVRASKGYHFLFDHLILLFLLSVAVYFRLDNLWHWFDLPKVYFHDGLPLILNVDGHYYLDLARSLADSDYAEMDQDRLIPSGVPRSIPPPLISYLTAWIFKFANVPLLWTAIILPAVVGAFVVFPVYLIGRDLGGRSLGIVAGLVTALSPHYLQRTSAGWFDTDCLVVTLPLMLAWLMMRFGNALDVRRWAYLAAAGVTTWVFLWWWDFGAAPVLVSFFLPALAALVFGRSVSGNRWYLISISLLIVLTIVVAKPEVTDEFYSKFSYLSETESGHFPSAGGNVVEQRNPTFTQLSNQTMAGEIGFYLAVLGLLGFAWRFKRDISYLAFPIGVGLLSLGAMRFMIYLAPVLGLGCGFIIYGLMSSRLVSVKIIALGLAAIILAPLFMKALSGTPMQPLRRAYQIEAMREMFRALPENAAVWTDWSHGYPLLFYAQSGTFADGSNHSGRLLHTLSLPLTVRSPRVAANWIRFYSVYGEKGVDRVHERMGKDWDRTFAIFRSAFLAGPNNLNKLLLRLKFKPVEISAWRQYLFPEMLRPVYVFLDFDKIRTPWYRFGSWNFSKQQGEGFVHEPLLGLKPFLHSIQNNKFNLDLKNGTAIYRGRKMMIKEVVNAQGKKHQYRKQGLTFEYDQKKGYGLLLSPNVLESVGRRLYSGHLNDSRYFKPVVNKLPLYGVWEVLPDKISN